MLPHLRWGDWSFLGSRILTAADLDKIIAYEGDDEKMQKARDTVRNVILDRAYVIYALDLPRPDIRELSTFEVDALAAAYRSMRGAFIRDLAAAFGQSAVHVATPTESPTAPKVDISNPGTSVFPKGMKGAAAIFADAKDAEAPVDPRLLEAERELINKFSSGKPFTSVQR